MIPMSCYPFDMKKKVDIDDMVIRIIEDSPPMFKSDVILGDGYSMDYTYRFHIDLEDAGGDLRIHSWMFDELRDKIRKWVGDVCERDGYTTVTIERSDGC